MDEKRLILHLRIIMGLFVLLVISAAVFGIVISQKVERMTVVAESVNARLNQMAVAAAPLGHAAVEKGVKVMQGMDAEDLSKNATDGLKDLSHTAKAWAEKKLGKPTTQP